MKYKQPILAGVAFLGLLLIPTSVAFAQIAPKGVSNMKENTMTSGTITEITADMLMLRSKAASEPMHYSSGKTTVYVDEAGAPVAMETVKSGQPATIHYTMTGDKMLATKVVVAKAVAPVREKNETLTTTTTDADNTQRNIADRDMTTLTPLDQGNSQADVDTTAMIRKGILDEKGMSMNAQNVKIITNQGHVTLRGPVNNAEEKRLIGSIANKATNANAVDNQLEVKLATKGTE